jgi:DNA-binding response OmpR family regulator
VEDEEDLAVSLKYNLEKEGGYTVVTARTGEEGLATAHRTRFDLVILDLMLPEMDGLDVCRSLRAIPEYAPVPIFFLTARVEESDKLIGLEMGADDYLTKPFSMKELLARVKAHLRRSDRTAAPGQGVYRGGGIEMDYEGHILRSGDREIPLTRLEFALLAALIRGRGRVLSRDHLLEKVWGYDYPGDTRTVDVHVRRLRSKLGRPGERIETVIGVGYRFRDSGAPSGGD